MAQINCDYETWRLVDIVDEQNMLVGIVDTKNRDELSVQLIDRTYKQNDPSLAEK